MLLLKRPYLFFTLFIVSWIPNVVAMVLDVVDVELPYTLNRILIHSSYICILLQAFFAIVYWVSLYLRRKQKQVANLRLNLLSVLLTAVLFILFFNEVIMVCYLLFFYK